MAKNELENFNELINDIVKAILYEVKKEESNFTLFLQDSHTTEYTFTNKPDTFGKGVAFQAYQSFKPELKVNLTVHLNVDMKYERCYLKIKEEYPDGVYVSSSLLGNDKNQTHLYITSLENENLKELGEYMYNEYIYPNLIMRQGDLKKIVNLISPSYNRDKTIDDILNDDEDE